MIKIHKLSEDEIKYIQPSADECAAASAGFHEACRFKEKTTGDFWQGCEKILKDWDSSASINGAKFDHKRMELIYHEPEE